MSGRTNSVAEYRERNIPVDILALIASKLKSIEDLERFGAVCKQWCVARDYFKHRALPHTPWLVAKKRPESSFMVHLPLAECPFSIRIDTNKMMRGASILCSKDGWLLMNKGSYRVFFFSFFSKSIIKLPNLPKAGPKFSGFTFTSSPTSKGCLVFGLSPHSYSNRLCVVASVSVGDKNWTWRAFNFNDRFASTEDLPCSNNPVYHRGKFYCVWSRGKLAVFPRELDSCETLLGSIVGRSRKSYLLEVDGELFAVFALLMCNYYEVYVCKRDDSKNKWHKVHDIGEYMFCVSDRTTYAKKATAQHMRNKLYFPNLEGKNGVFFCLKSEKFHSIRDDFSCRNIFDTEVVLESCWMDPTQHSTPEWTEKCADCFVLSMNENDDEDDDVDEDDTTTADTKPEGSRKELYNGLLDFDETIIDDGPYDQGDSKGDAGTKGGVLPCMGEKKIKLE